MNETVFVVLGMRHHFFKYSDTFPSPSSSLPLSVRTLFVVRQGRCHPHMRIFVIGCLVGRLCRHRKETVTELIPVGGHPSAFSTSWSYFPCELGSECHSR